MVFAVGGCLWAAGAAFSGAPAGLAARTGSLRGAVMSADGVSRREMMQSASAAAAAAAASGSFLPQAASAKSASTWQQVDLPIATEAPILFDIDFDPQNPENGWICGNKGTFLQTRDGGKTWAAKSFANLDPDEEINYRFTKMSWKNGEGWIIGKPAILLHTRDSDASLENAGVPQKRKLLVNTRRAFVRVHFRFLFIHTQAVLFPLRARFFLLARPFFFSF